MQQSVHKVDNVWWLWWLNYDSLILLKVHPEMNGFFFLHSRFMCRNIFANVIILKSTFIHIP